MTVTEDQACSHPAWAKPGSSTVIFNSILQTSVLLRLLFCF